MTKSTELEYFVVNNEGYVTSFAKTFFEQVVTFSKVDKFVMTDISACNTVTFLYPSIYYDARTGSYMYSETKEIMPDFYQSDGMITVPTGWYSRLERNYKREEM